MGEDGASKYSYSPAPLPAARGDDLGEESAVAKSAVFGVVVPLPNGALDESLDSVSFAFLNTNGSGLGDTSGTGAGASTAAEDGEGKKEEEKEEPAEEEADLE